ncbi:glycosyltransferase family 2 protein [Halocynthiibacter sp.]|uniref:glycosyltransferase family 2 protein n=1 Tax=Halocynthiibacter sp. TaxID=1979210 RepID=UPI003C53576F
MSPRVSFVIPTKNRPEGVRRAVTSVLAALPEDGEVIVVDDASDPPATHALREVTDPRMILYVNPGPHGPSAARNFGVRQTQAPVLMFLDDDDLLVEDYCLRVISRIDSLPDDCTFGFSASYHLEPDGSWTEVQSISPAGVLGDETPLKYRQAGLGMGCWITRAAFDAVGGLDESIDVNEDTEFSVRLAASGHRCYCDQTPGVILIHDPVRSASDQSSITKAAGARARFRGFEYILLKHQDFLKGHGAFRRKMFTRVVKYRVRAGSVAGWFRFCAQHRPVSDVVLYIAPGALWLGLSKLLRRKP